MNASKGYQKNKLGHVHQGRKTEEGYGLCSLCGCRENTDEYCNPCAGEGDIYFSSLTPSKIAKESGLKSLLQVQQLTKQSAQTLINWHRDKPELFRVVIAGCVALTNPPTGGNRGIGDDK